MPCHLSELNQRFVSADNVGCYKKGQSSDCSALNTTEGIWPRAGIPCLRNASKATLRRDRECSRLATRLFTMLILIAV